MTDSRGNFLANAAQGSRKDIRDAVVAARKAFSDWSARSGYNRGQILYRIAEMLEERRGQFVDQVAAAEGVSAERASSVVDEAIDRWVWYAGWTDKIDQVFGNTNPVAGPYLNYTAPDPAGVIGILAPQGSSLLGLVSVLAPVIAGGNTAVLVTSERAPLPGISLAEVIATSDVPGGVVNIVSGRTAELAPWLASHADVNGIDLVGAPADLVTELRSLATGNLKIVARAPEHEPDWHAEPDTTRLTKFLEAKTVWHPVGV